MILMNYVNAVRTLFTAVCHQALDKKQSHWDLFCPSDTLTDYEHYTPCKHSLSHSHLNIVLTYKNRAFIGFSSRTQYSGRRRRYTFRPDTPPPRRKMNTVYTTIFHRTYWVHVEGHRWALYSLFRYGLQKYIRFGNLKKLFTVFWNTF